MRRRMISPSFFSDSEIVANFNTQGRLLYIGLWCVADDSGCFEPDTLQLKMQIFPGDDVSAENIAAWMERLAELKKIIFYEVNSKSYAWIKNFHKHQKLDRPSPPQVPLPPWVEWVGEQKYSSKERHKWHYNIRKYPVGDSSTNSRGQFDDVSGVIEVKEVKEISTRTRRQFDDMSTNKIVAAFQKCIYPGITPFDLERLEAYLEDGLAPDVIIFAIEEAANNNARRVAYITRILDRLRDAGITTREAAEADKTSRTKNTRSGSSEVAAPYHRIVRAPRGDAASPPDDGDAVPPDKPPPHREDADSSRDAASLENADFSPGQRLAEAWGTEK